MLRSVRSMAMITRFGTRNERSAPVSSAAGVVSATSMASPVETSAFRPRRTADAGCPSSAAGKAIRKASIAAAPATAAARARACRGRSAARTSTKASSTSVTMMFPASEFRMIAPRASVSLTGALGERREVRPSSRRSWRSTAATESMLLAANVLWSESGS